MTEQERLAQDAKDKEAIAQDQAKAAQWAKDYPGRPYVSHLTPHQQSIRDAQRQTAAAAEKKAQADVNNADQARRQGKVDAAEVDAQEATAKELEAEDAQAPYGRDAHGNPLPKPKP